jgi:D-tyrosyl-tRNA(Tyr) deacylase
MLAVVQRVKQAEVTVGGQAVGAIGPGLLVLLGVARGDSPGDARYLAEKIAHLRVFDDQSGKMNRSLLESGGAVLVVSQFTLLGECAKGRRPSYDRAAPAAEAEPLCTTFSRHLSALGPTVATGHFGAVMDVSLTNDGPVTLIVKSREEE